MSTEKREPVRIPGIGQGKRGKDGHLLYLLRQAAMMVAKQTERLLAEVGLTLPLYSALTMISSYERISSAELSRLSMLTAQSANETVQKLVGAGLIVRRRDPNHGRMLQLHITTAGRARLARGRKFTDLIEKRLVDEARLSDEKGIKEWLANVALEFSASEVSFAPGEIARPAEAKRRA